MHTTTSGRPLTTIRTRVTDPPLELFIAEKAFRPNPTTVRFARTVPIRDGDVVLDIGTGIGPLAITAAMGGAAQVHGVDPVEVHCELARLNVAKYGVEDRVQIHHGHFFEPFEKDPELRDIKADVIIGDVSGIAEPVARALGWYSDEVPTGGDDGTDVIIDLLQRAAGYLQPDGAIYFPIAVDLSDGRKIVEAAREMFDTVENAMDRENVMFPISEDELAAIDAAYGNARPPFINIQLRGGTRPFWRGQIWRAARPRK